MKMNDMTDNNRDVTFPYLDEKTDEMVIAKLMIAMDAFCSVWVAEQLTSLDKSTQYRQRTKGQFPLLKKLTPEGRRKGYKLQDLKKWLDDPLGYRER
jgi:predicted DNA-binding transcriptional regulator AlpA